MVVKREKKTINAASANARMSGLTAQEYIGLGKLPSELKLPRSFRTRLNAFADTLQEAEGCGAIQSRT